MTQTHGHHQKHKTKAPVHSSTPPEVPLLGCGVGFLHRPNAFCKRSHCAAERFCTRQIICKPPGTFCLQHAQMVQGVDAMNQSTWDDCVVAVLHTKLLPTTASPAPWRCCHWAASSRTNTWSPHEVSRGDLAACLRRQQGVPQCMPKYPTPSDPRRRPWGSPSVVALWVRLCEQVGPQFRRLSLARRHGNHY